MSSGDLLLAEIELKRRQIEEVKLSAAVRHSEMFFESALETNSSAFVRPAIAPAVWPESEEAALAGLAPEAGSPPEAQRTTQERLTRAWLEYQTHRQEHTLLRPMSAFAEDLSKASREQFEIGGLSLGGLQNRIREAVNLNISLIRADYAVLGAQLDVLEILNRTAAIE